MDDTLVGNFSSVVNINIGILQQSLDEVLDTRITNAQIRRVCSKISVVKAISAFLGVSEYSDVFRAFGHICKDLYNRDRKHKKKTLSLIRLYVKAISNLEVDGRIFEHIPELEFFLNFPESFIFFDKDPMDLVINDDGLELSRVDIIQNHFFLKNLQKSIEKETLKEIKSTYQLLKDSFNLSFFDDLEMIIGDIESKYNNVCFNIQDKNIKLFKDKSLFFKDTLDLFLEILSCKDNSMDIIIGRDEELSYYVKFRCNKKNNKDVKYICDFDQEYISVISLLDETWKEIFYLMRKRIGSDRLNEVFHLFLTLRLRMKKVSIIEEKECMTIEVVFPYNFFLSEGICAYG